MRISLFVPCFNDALFPGTGKATVKILEKLGHEVVFPEDQTCCGQIHFNTGYRTEARRLMNRFLEIFDGSEVVVAPSASCVAMVREHFLTVARDVDGTGVGEAVRHLASRTYELSEFLVEVSGVDHLGAVFPHRVALHPTCHSFRGIDVGDAPRRLLENVQGLELVDLQDPTGCCGFGGTFAVKNPHASMAMLEDKIRDFQTSGAEVLTAVDNSCLLHIAGGLHRLGALCAAAGDGPPGKGQGPGEVEPACGLRVMHLAEILSNGWGERP
jgi:L-lactate dehydrogenase complex protein LldE